MTAIAIQCPKCKAWLQSKNALNWHMLQEEKCYPGSMDGIADKLLHQINTHKGNVELLLQAIPQTRGDDRILAEWYAVHFLHTKFYSYDDHQFHEKQGLSFEKLKLHVSEQTLGRRRRELQEEDKEMYHKSITLQDGTVEYLEEWKQSHSCILASSQTQLKREILEGATRQYYGGGLG